MNLHEHAMLFDCAGEQLVGIVTTPECGNTVGVLVVVGGPQYRIGGHRQFVLLARRLAREGVPVMRFDYRGMGDSSGDVISFEQIVPDISAAIAAFKKACPSLERVVLWGLCDAASACLLYWHGTRDARVAGMVLADPWIFSDEAFAQSQVRHYLRRPFQREFWTKLMGGGIDLTGAVKDMASAVLTARHKRVATEKPLELPFQEQMTLGMDSFPGPVLLVLSGDLTAKNFKEYCQSHPKWQGLIGKKSVDRSEVPDANHTFATAASREQVETVTLQWFRKRLPFAGSE